MPTRTRLTAESLRGVEASKPLLLFVCVENRCRSQMAEAFARGLSRDGVVVYSAGLRPAEQVHPTAIAAMRELGYTMDSHYPKGLSALPDVEYDIAVTMDCGDDCPPLHARRREDWPVPCPKAMPLEQFRGVRNQIQQRLKALLAGFPLGRYECH